MSKRAYTPADIAERWSCCHNTVLNNIRSGELVAINIGTGRRSRYVVTSEALEDRRTVSPPSTPAKRRPKMKRTDVIEFFT